MYALHETTPTTVAIQMLKQKRVILDPIHLTSVQDFGRERKSVSKKTASMQSKHPCFFSHPGEAFHVFNPFSLP